MNLDEAIKYYEEKAFNSNCGNEYEQLVNWLKELLENGEKDRHLIDKIKEFKDNVESSCQYEPNYLKREGMNTVLRDLLKELES
ncbi:MAG: hypothetical protein K9L17_14110 [Clostridiales bacterium]|nr:hypothetical protein [Clostridiales bacterium]MCF8023804.1 hypothetical protein [Clostridiales bacterium]